jgi:hypothetical protein
MNDGLEGRLEEGVELESIWWTEGELTINKEYGTRKGGITKLTRLVVKMQNGQMAHVPWVQAFYENEPPKLFNCALMDGVSFVWDGDSKTQS